MRHLRAALFSVLVSHLGTPPQRSRRRRGAMGRQRRRSRSSSRPPPSVEPKVGGAGGGVAAFDEDGAAGRASDEHARGLRPGPGSAVVAQKPELRNVEPFKQRPSGDREAIAKVTWQRDLEKILAATLTGMTVAEFQAEARNGSRLPGTRVGNGPIPSCLSADDGRVLKLLHANGYKTYIVTGGGQDFVRIYSEQIYGVPPEQVVGTAGGTRFGFDKEGRPKLTKEPKLLLNDDFVGKPEGIHLVWPPAPCGVWQLGRRSADARIARLSGIASGWGRRAARLRDPGDAYGWLLDRLARRSAHSRSRFTTKPRVAVGSSPHENDWKWLFAFDR